METLSILVIIFLPLIAQLYISLTYKTSLKKEASKEQTGFDVARQILDKHGLQDVLILETNGTLTDHYDPSRKVVKLSKNIYRGTNIAANAVAAHEVGHAIQDKEGYTFLKIRSLIFPIVSITSRLSYIIILLGFFFEATNLIWLGIITVGIGVIFQIITLPVEFNASSRALIELNELNLVNEKDLADMRKMLSAAAFTYVASTIAEIFQLMRLINMVNDRN
ncbi:MAG: zinc metallopeptidase [Bacilli bacterium]|nr:zinc metallopeptidase [Bacilli bacterium]